MCFQVYSDTRAFHWGSQTRTNFAIDYSLGIEQSFRMRTSDNKLKVWWNNILITDKDLRFPMEEHANQDIY